ncbi:MAG: isoleucine--tRNA ligase [Phycisphaerae bacterium]|nr:isoleucine--tRNA ligase [Phycisphaerae bacterium]
MSDKNKGYRDTLNLPKTGFSMKANLVQKEPQLRKQWAKNDIYGQIREARKDSPLYILHDGPPYANGDIHMGHVINKVLKDLVIKYKTMTGFDAPYIPGWDCHGLPIESKVMTDLGDQARDMDKQTIRQDCKKYASRYVKLQTQQFQALGIFGDYANPYLTFKPRYEEGILEVFADLVDKGIVYKQLKPIHWSVGCETALAEAELEYKDITSSSVFVNFPADSNAVSEMADLGLVTREAADHARVCFMIWTTTPWTLAANLAVAVHPHLDYVALSYEKEGRAFVSVVGADRVQAIVAAGDLAEGHYTISETRVKGCDLEGLRYQHPFVGANPTDQDAYMVITADYVTTEDGSGLVHTAPGHGQEDYMSGQKNGLAVYSPVRDNGTYDDTVPEWLIGKSVLSVDRDVNAHLAEIGLLFSQKDIVHSYPHCWRSKGPVIFRATEQWFVGVDRTITAYGKTLRELAEKSTDFVTWIPAWGQKRIDGMLESRPDWCISRQRSWGLPIPVFVNGQGESLLTKESVMAVARYVGERGSNCWFTDSPRQILGEDFDLPDGFSWDDLHKEENIFDVWFESGCSWYSVCVKQAGWPVPVDLYLEGSDQHRGWFQLSLLPALGATGQPPFKSVLTHGFTVDEKGMKQSKSLGNYVNALDEINKYGSDILRLWVSSVNYQEDIRCNDQIIGRMQDAYRKIRNTLRYLFGNTSDFDPNTDAVPFDTMYAIDQWALQKLNTLVAEVNQAYESFVFHKVFSLIYQFCTVEMSSIYMDVLKDRMYCDIPNSQSRRSAQTAMSEILNALIRLLTPILVHTCEEAWEALDHKPDPVDSVHLATMPTAKSGLNGKFSLDQWDSLLTLRDDILRCLEGLRQDKAIASNQEASVTVNADQETTDLLNAFGTDHFAALCIVSAIELIPGQDATIITATKSEAQKCQRCWNYVASVGTHESHPDLCHRCHAVLT